MVGNAYENQLPGLIENNQVSVSLIDEAVGRILRKKIELELFDDPFKYCDEKRQQLNFSPIKTDEELDKQDKNLLFSLKILIISFLSIKSQNLLQLSALWRLVIISILVHGLVMDLKMIRCLYCKVLKRLLMLILKFCIIKGVSQILKIHQWYWSITASLSLNLKSRSTEQMEEEDRFQEHPALCVVLRISHPHILPQENTQAQEFHNQEGPIRIRHLVPGCAHFGGELFLKQFSKQVMQSYKLHEADFKKYRLTGITDYE